VLAPGQTTSLFTGDKAYFAAPAGTMKVLARMLEGRLAIEDRVPRPVIDATRLGGRYDLKFWWRRADVNDSAAEGPSLLSALESQLGLNPAQEIRAGRNPGHRPHGKSPFGELDTARPSAATSRPSGFG
jgi:uncharacterized protein (TIGR03435 family)